jgi:hypothetical protein
MKTSTKIALTIIRGYLMIWVMLAVTTIACFAVVLEFRLAVGIGGGLATIVAGVITWLVVKARVEETAALVKRRRAGGGDG